MSNENKIKLPMICFDFIENPHNTHFFAILGIATKRDNIQIFYKGCAQITDINNTYFSINKLQN